MDKPRPPEYPDYAESDESIVNLNKLTYLMIRQYLRKPPNNYPRYFYKYLSSDMKEEHIRSLLIDSDLYLASCVDFNDPFDTTATVIRSGTLKDLRKRFGEVVNENSPGIKKREKEVMVSKMMETYARNPDSHKKILERNTQQAGIFSLSENKRDILMWSHYASQHKGMLLQFELAKDPASLLFALKMHYSDEYPTYDLRYSFTGQFKKIMLRKSVHWKYENEWRILRIAGARTYQPFKPQALTALVFGCKSEDRFRDKVIGILKEREAIGYPVVKVYKAEMDKFRYAVKYFKLAS